MSMYGPQDPYGQPGDPNAPRPPGPALPGDTQPQSGSSDPYQPPGYPDAPPPMHPGTPPHQPYGQPAIRTRMECLRRTTSARSVRPAIR